MKKTKLTLQSQVNIETVYGNFNFATFTNNANDPMPHLALFTNPEDWQEEVPVRIHSECMTGDLFGSKRCDCGDQLHFAMDYLQNHGGLILYLRQEGRGIGIINKLKAYVLQDQGYDTAEANRILGFGEDMREYDDAMKMLEYFKIKKIHLLTNNPNKLDFFDDIGIQVVKRIPVELDPNDVNYGYLKTKKEHFGHFLNKL